MILWASRNTINSDSNYIYNVIRLKIMFNQLYHVTSFKKLEIFYLLNDITKFELGTKIGPESNKFQLTFNVTIVLS